MNFEQIFGQAEWIGAPEDAGFVTIRDTFDAKAGEKAEITVLGFGRFILYVNGKRAHDDYFLPLNTFFELSESYKIPKDTVLAPEPTPANSIFPLLFTRAKTI